MCYHYGCTEEGTVRLKAWGPGEIREFCEDHAEIRLSLSGYTDKVDS